jgi:hypothetical protein
MNTTARLALAAALGFAASVALAQDAPATPPVKAVAKTSAKPAKPKASRQQLKSEAAGLALAVETSEAISENQLAIAQRVMTGASDCEFNQQVSVQAVDGKPGHFKVGFRNATYTMVPEETSTGAVRLEDKRAGVVWLQIPAKSMLMNQKIGQRMVDSCLHSDQRAAASGGSAPTIGIAQQ